MRQHTVWVDYKFIQGTAWYLGHHIRIVTTQSTPENPYILIDGSQGEDSVPSHHVPLLIGSQLDLHFQSLLPLSQDQVMRVLNEAEFPPLQRKPEKERIEKFHDGRNKNLTQGQKQKVNMICPNCKKVVGSLQVHFKTSLICKQVSNQDLNTKTIKQENKEPATRSDRNEKGKKSSIQKNPVKTNCKGCHKECINIKKSCNKIIYMPECLQNR